MLDIFALFFLLLFTTLIHLLYGDIFTLEKPSGFRFSLFGSFAFFLLFYIVVWIQIGPNLIYQCQQPVFFFGARFFRPFLEYPGGLVEYAGAFLSQFFVHNWAGALIITFLAFILYAETRLILRFFHPSHTSRFYDFLPSLLLFSVHGRYFHPLAVSLAFIFTIGVFILYLRLSGLRPWLRFIIFSILCIIVYYHAGGHFLLFATLCALYEILKMRQFVLGITVILLTPILSTVAYRSLFVISRQDAFARLLPFEHNYPFAPGPYLLYGFFPFLILVIFLSRFQAWRKISSFLAGVYAGIKPSWIKRSIQWLVLALIAVLILLLSVDNRRKTTLKISHYAYEKDWQHVLDVAADQNPTYILAQYHVNRALYHTGRLSSDLFSYPQDWGVNGLILPLAFNTAPLEKSDIFLELGHINEALRWSHEALTIKGDTPRALQRLVIVNLLKNEIPAVQKYLNVLKKTFYRKWAENMEKLITSGTLSEKDPWFRFLKSQVNQTDFFIRADKPLNDIETIFKGNPSNKMAFEYLMAGYLLTGQISEIKKQMNRFSDFGYTTLPRPYEEALFVYMMQKDPEALKSSIKQFSRQTVIRFKGFSNLMTSQGQNMTRIQNQLKHQYGDTFWYYMVSKKITLQ